MQAILPKSERQNRCIVSIRDADEILSYRAHGTAKAAAMEIGEHFKIPKEAWISRKKKGSTAAVKK